MSGQSRIDSRVEEYWDWVAVALFLLLSIDLLTSMYAAGVVGLDHETNPLMAWVLAQSLVVVVAVHTALAVAAVGLFYALFELVKGLPTAYRRPVTVAVEALLGLLVAAGLFVFANNLVLIVFGRGLV